MSQSLDDVASGRAAEQDGQFMKMHMTTRFYGALALLGMVVASCSGSDAASDGPSSDVPTTDVSTSESPTGDAPVDGFLFESADGDYSLVFPEEPTLTAVPVALPTGELNMDLYVLDTGGSAYFTSVIDYPAEAVPVDEPQVVLTNARDGAIANVGGELRDSDFIETNGLPGIRFTFDVDSEGIVGNGIAVFYYSEPKLYQTFGLGETEKTDTFETFVDSFTFTDDTATES